MPESSTSVRYLQHHLRQAGTLLAAKEFGAASAHIDAALAIDPGSLAAQTLRERLELQQTAQGRASVPDIPPAPPDPVATRFVPAGVDAASWLDFEKRVRERRFRALLETAERALAEGSGPTATSALDEARELYPDSGEVELLSARVALVSSRVSVTAREPLFRSRPLRAASLLIVGVTALMVLDWVRSDARNGTTRASLAGVRKPGAGVAFVKDAFAGEAAPEPTGTSARPTDVAPDLLPEFEPAIAPRPEVAPVVTGSRTVGESSVSDSGGGEPSYRETPDRYVMPRQNVADAVVLAPVLRGEIPDYYVAPSRPNASTPVIGPNDLGGGTGSAGAIGPITSVVRQPGPAVDTVGTGRPSTAVNSPAATPVAPPVAAAPAGAAAVVPSTDELRVESLLRLYTRAYERLDSGAVRAIWPSVDERALARAFASLSSQTLSFDSCDITVNGATARASCHGHASYVGKVGNQTPRTESRTVQFELRRDADAWKIERADARK